MLCFPLPFYLCCFIFCSLGDLSISYRLRFLCAADMYLNADLYSTSFVTDDYFGMAITGLSENLFMSTKNRSVAVEDESLVTCETVPRPDTHSRANVLKRPVLSAYPEKTGFPYQDLFNREFTPLSYQPEQQTPIYMDNRRHTSAWDVHTKSFCLVKRFLV